MLPDAPVVALLVLFAFTLSTMLILTAFRRGDTGIMRELDPPRRYVPPGEPSPRYDDIA
ncbi:MAG: hypothetical protein V3S31_02245 [Dehalococcoidia bacterium]